MPEGISYFSVFGLDPVLRLEENRLRESFYELSRKLHPDRFSAGANAQDAIHSTQWSTLVNKAYQTLRDPVKRSYYLLDLFGVKEAKTTQVPLDLAETYFELQDALGEPGGEARLQTFKKDLQTMQEEHEKTWDVLADEWTSGGSREKLLSRLQAYLQKRRYLESMLADVEKKLRGETKLEGMTSR